MLGYQNSCSKATPFESCECRAETEDHWFGAFSATWVWKAKARSSTHNSRTGSRTEPTTFRPPCQSAKAECAAPPAFSAMARL